MSVQQEPRRTAPQQPLPRYKLPRAPETGQSAPAASSSPTPTTDLLAVSIPAEISQDMQWRTAQMNSTQRVATAGMHESGRLTVQGVAEASAALYRTGRLVQQADSGGWKSVELSGFVEAATQDYLATLQEALVSSNDEIVRTVRQVPDKLRTPSLFERIRLFFYVRSTRR
jgi:hypothetical protein